MLSIKNVSGSLQVWGGVEFADGQERVVDAEHKKHLAQDTNFYTHVLNGTCQVYIDLMHEQNVIAACAYVYGETKRDYEGNMITRAKQVPDDWHRQQKVIQFSLSTANSIKETRRPFVNTSECVLYFHKLQDNELVQCGPNEAVMTSLLWNHPHQVMPAKAEIRLNDKDNNIIGYIGNYGIEQFNGGMFAMGISFAFSNVYKFEALEPRLLTYNLITRFTHPVGYQIPIEIFFEYFTNFEPVS